VRKEDHRLIRSGPYAIVRHPIYTGLIAMALGRSFDVGTAAGIALALALAAALWVNSRREERLMAATFRGAYPDYRRRVVPRRRRSGGSRESPRPGLAGDCGDPTRRRMWPVLRGAAAATALSQCFGIRSAGARVIGYASPGGGP